MRRPRRGCGEYDRIHAARGRGSQRQDHRGARLRQGRLALRGRRLCRGQQRHRRDRAAVLLRAAAPCPCRRVWRPDRRHHAGVGFQRRAAPRAQPGRSRRAPRWRQAACAFHSAPARRGLTRIHTCEAIGCVSRAAADHGLRAAGLAEPDRGEGGADRRSRAGVLCRYRHRACRDSAAFADQLQRL